MSDPRIPGGSTTPGQVDYVAQIVQQLEPLMKSMSDSLDTFRDLQPVFDDMKDSKFIKSVQELGKTIKDMAKSKIQGDVISMLFSTLEPLLDLLTMFSPIFDAIGALLQAIFLPVMQDLQPIIQLITNAIVSLIPFARQLWDIFKNSLVVIFQALWNVGKFLWDVLVNIWTAFKNFWGWLSGVFQVGFEAFIGIIQFIWDGIVAVIKLGANIIIGIINALILIWNGLDFLNLFPDTPYIEYLAEGGILTRPTLMVGGEKEPEAVLPLSKMGGMMGGNSELLLMDIHETLEDIKVSTRRQLTMGRRRFG